MYGQKPDEAQRIYAEGLDLILQGLTRKTLDFAGEFFNFEDVPMELEPLQKPHPPLWYGVHSPESAERAARRGLHIVSLDPVVPTRTFTDRFREVWTEVHGDAAMPKIGLGRFVVVADGDGEALRIARRAYPVWHRSFNHLFRLRGSAPRHQRPSDFDGVIASGAGDCRQSADRPEIPAIADRKQPAPTISSASSPSATSPSTRRSAPWISSPKT